MALIANRSTVVVIALAAAGLSLGCYTTGPYGYGSTYSTSDYYGAGDPIQVDYGGSVYAYYGHHPHYSYAGGYCYTRGRHHHDYRPHRSHSYNFNRGVYFYSGVFGSNYRYPGQGVRQSRVTRNSPAKGGQAVTRPTEKSN